MSKKHTTLNASIIDTRRPTVAGADRHPGWHALRKIAARITTPLLPDDYLHLANPLWSARELRGRILGVRRETEDSATLFIKPGWGFSFDYQPGQYIGIGLLVDGRWRWRSYSLTSSPAASGSARMVTVTVKAMPEGFLSTHLVAGVKPGTIVRLAAPQGNFVLPDPAPPLILFLTAGSGITPVMSMLRTLVRRNQITDVVHLHSAPTAADVMFGAELAALVLNQADKVWSSAGASDRLHLERFAVSKTAPAGAGGTVTFARSGKSVAADAATSLMDAGEGAGVQLPFGCRMGICQSCVVDLVEGHVRDLRTGQRHEPGTRVQTCVSAASGDCVLDI
ncbi:ferredoxin reductase [Mycobacterium tuberculosis]